MYKTGDCGLFFNFVNKFDKKKSIFVVDLHLFHVISFPLLELLKESFRNTEKKNIKHLEKMLTVFDLT